MTENQKRLRCPECKTHVYNFKRLLKNGDELCAEDLESVNPEKYSNPKPNDFIQCPECKKRFKSIIAKGKYSEFTIEMCGDSMG